MTQSSQIEKQTQRSFKQPSIDRSKFSNNITIRRKTNIKFSKINTDDNSDEESSSSDSGFSSQKRINRGMC